MSQRAAIAALVAAVAIVLPEGCGSDPAPAPRPPSVAAPRPGPHGERPPRALRTGRCYGAAAALPGRGCNDPRFATMVFPAPAVAAQIISPAPCRRDVVYGLLHACWWGAPAARARRVVALVGDSHASVWRPAFEHVVRARRWRAVSLSRAGCPLTLAHPHLPGARRRRACMEFNRQVQAWIGRHRAISVVFLAAHRGHVVPPPGVSAHDAQLAGYEAAIRGLWRHGVRHVVVLRDTPRNGPATLGCIESAVALHRPPGPACAVPRVYALRSDPLAQAARALGSSRSQVIDLSRLMCGPAACPPVIGGVLVLRDRQHMTDAFSATLGPFLLRAIDRLARRW